MSKQFFITGTDTGVGKTVLSALLCAALDAVYWKPIQTGAGLGNGETDRQTVMRLAEIPEEKTIPETYCFEPAVSPHLAARWAGREIDLNSIQRAKFPASQALVVEGAGGALVPINQTQFTTDLIRHLAYPVVLACRSSLGTINHTLLSLQALRHAQIKVLGAVMIGAENSDNRQAIEQFGQVRVIGAIPELDKISRAALIDVFRTKFDGAVFV